MQDIQPEREDWRLIAIFSEHLIESKKAPSTRAAYQATLQQVAVFLHRHDATLAALEPEKLAAYFDWRRADGKREATLAREVTAIRSFLKFHHGERAAEELVTQLDPIRLSPERSEPLSVADAEDLVRQGGLHTEDLIRDRAILATFFYTGAKVSEAAALNWEDVDLENDRLWLGAHNGNARQLPLHQVHRALLVQLAKPDVTGSAVFRSKHSGRLTDRTLRRIVADAGAVAGLERVNPERIRQACATAWAGAGRDKETIARWMGYTTANSARRRIGGLTAQISACPQCGEPGNAACTTCYGTAEVVEAPKRYVQGLKVAKALGRLRAIRTELTGLGRRARRSRRGPSDSVARTADAATVVAAVIAVMEPLADGRRPNKPLPRAAESKDESALQQRLHACGTDMRKLAGALEERTWIEAELAGRLAGAGATIEILARELN